MRQVGIIGAGMPALIIARTLIDHGARVRVFGNPAAAGTFSSMGPRHLWANDETRKIGARFGATCAIDSCSVLWLEGSSLTTEPSMFSVGGYQVKARGQVSSDLPCRGQHSFETIRDGWEMLLAELKIKDIDIEETLVREVLGGGVIRTKYGTTMWDRVVTTIPPHVFFRMWPAMRDRDIPEPGLVTYVWIEGSPIAELSISRSVLVYCGDEDVWWHRASWTPKGWCYETTRPPEEKVTGESKRVSARTQVLTGLGNLRGADVLPYPSWVIPVGRYAEWDGELMVSDVYERRGEYAKKILNGGT